MKYEISLAKFLSRYKYVEGEDLKKITHEEAIKLFPDLKRSTYEEVSNNRELLANGKIVFVDDGKRKIPYYIPEVLDDIDTMEFHREPVSPVEIDDNDYDYSSMSVYELRCLLKRKFNSNRNQMNARKELNRRGITLNKKYNRNDIKKKMIEE